jgi:hypothetical protein
MRLSPYLGLCIQQSETTDPQSSAAERRLTAAAKDAINLGIAFKL